MIVDDTKIYENQMSINQTLINTTYWTFFAHIYLFCFLFREHFQHCSSFVNQDKIDTQ